MLKVRLQRVGRRNDPSFRVVVTESTRGPKSGKYIEMLGSYNPRQKSVALKGDRIKYWLSVGAQVTGTMHNLLIKEKITTGKKINVLPKKSPIKKEVVNEAATEKAEAKDIQKTESGVEETKEEPKEEISSEENDSKSESNISPDKEESVKTEETSPSSESDSKDTKESVS